MAGLLGKKFPTPVGMCVCAIAPTPSLENCAWLLTLGIARPMAPFYIAGAIIFYGINSLATTLANTDEYRNDPRNPNKNLKPTH
ncbi:hypothetical protein E4T39_01344 [Aureobasidium subglaciale]|nr:hypothetical protein E4T39_01344 [Aureobasidium subglaciale]